MKNVHYSHVPCGYAQNNELKHKLYFSYNLNEVTCKSCLGGLYTARRDSHIFDKHWVAQQEARSNDDTT